MQKVPTTPAIQYLRERKVEFDVFQYEYTLKGGAKQTANELGVELHKVVKTLVMEGEGVLPFIVLMHGDKEVSTKALARYLGCKSVFPSDSKTATNWTGYVFGGTSPFGTRKSMRTLVQKSILELDEIYINGGKQGLILKITPDILTEVLDYELVDVAIENRK
jgi:Cys-tRNA(Pro) deacylase